MDFLHIAPHFEWWIVWEDEGTSRVCQKCYDESKARLALAAHLKDGAAGDYTVHKVTVIRTAEKLDW